MAVQEYCLNDHPEDKAWEMKSLRGQDVCGEIKYFSKYGLFDIAQLMMTKVKFNTCLFFFLKKFHYIKWLGKG